MSTLVLKKYRCNGESNLNEEGNNDENYEEKKEAQVGVEDSDDEERSIIELTKPEPKNVKVEGVFPNLPDKPQVLNEFVSQQTEENIAIMRKQAKMKRRVKRLNRREESE